MQSFSIADTRSQLPSIIHAVETGDVTQLTRNGKPVAVLLSNEEYETLVANSKGSLLQALGAFKELKHAAEISDNEVD
jgi:prevent-host-death family protein